MVRNNLSTDQGVMALTPQTLSPPGGMALPVFVRFIGSKNRSIRYD